MTKIERPNQLLFDKSYHHDSTHYLSVEIGSNGLCYTVFDPKQQKYHGLASYQLSIKRNFLEKIPQLKTILEQDVLLNKNYAKVSVSFDFPKTTLIPTSIYSETNNQDYLDINFDKTVQHTLMKDRLINVDLLNLYLVPSALKELFDEQFNHLDYIHSATVLIENSILNHQNESGSFFQVMIREEKLELVVIKDQEFVFFNTFDYQTTEDFIYYILFVVQQLKLTKDTLRITLFGKIEAGSDLFTTLSKYAENVSIGHRPTIYNYHTVLKKLQPPFHYNLFSQLICV